MLQIAIIQNWGKSGVRRKDLPRTRRNRSAPSFLRMDAVGKPDLCAVTQPYQLPAAATTKVFWNLSCQYLYLSAVGTRH